MPESEQTRCIQRPYNSPVPADCFPVCREIIRDFRFVALFQHNILRKTEQQHNKDRKGGKGRPQQKINAGGCSSLQIFPCSPSFSSAPPGRHPRRRTKNGAASLSRGSRARYDQLGTPPGNFPVRPASHLEFIPESAKRDDKFSIVFRFPRNILI